MQQPHRRYLRQRRYTAFSHPHLTVRTQSLSQQCGSPQYPRHPISRQPNQSPVPADISGGVTICCCCECFLRFALPRARIVFSSYSILEHRHFLTCISLTTWKCRSVMRQALHPVGQVLPPLWQPRTTPRATARSRSSSSSTSNPQTSLYSANPCGYGGTHQRCKGESGIPHLSLCSCVPHA